jgi:hypothetical protein
VFGGTTRKFWNAFCPHRKKEYRSLLRSNSIALFAASAAGVPKLST